MALGRRCGGEGGGPSREGEGGVEVCVVVEREARGKWEWVGVCKVIQWVVDTNPAACLPSPVYANDKLIHT